MKFTKQDAFEKLKSLLTVNGKSPRMSDRSINDYVDTLLVAEQNNEELDLDAFIAKYGKPLVSFNGNIEFEVSAGINTFKDKWVKEHPATQPTDSKTTQTTNTDESPELKALMDRLSALEARNAELAKADALKNVQKSLLKKMKEKGITDESWSAGILEQITISEDMDVDSKADSLLKLYNKTQAYPPQNSTTPHSTSQSGELLIPSIAEAAKAAKARRDEQEKL